MKKNSVKSVLFSFGLLLFLGACNKGERETTTTINEDGKPSVVLIEKSKLSLTIKYTGVIKLNDSKDNFLSISPEGYVYYKKGKVKMSVKSDQSGNLTYDLYDGKNTLTMNDVGKKFVADIIQDMISGGFKPM